MFDYTTKMFDEYGFASPARTRHQQLITKLAKEPIAVEIMELTVTYFEQLLMIAFDSGADKIMDVTREYCTTNEKLKSLPQLSKLTGLNNDELALAITEAFCRCSHAMQQEAENEV